MGRPESAHRFRAPIASTAVSDPLCVMFQLRPFQTAALALSLVVPVASADTIHLVDGTKIEDVDVKAETLSVVEYDRSEVASDKVLRVEFSEMPDVVGEAELLAADGDVATAVLDLFYYVDSRTSDNGDRRHPWGPAYAAKRRIELLQRVNDLPGVVEAADLLIGRVPDSRYVPGAYLDKAKALVLQGKDAEAAKTLGQLVALAEEQALSPRYRLAAQVEQAAIDPSIKAEARIEALDSLAGAAGNEFPTVRDRAYVAQGELYIQLADVNESRLAELVGEARYLFELAMKSEQGEDATRAGALAGLGDCEFATATRTGDAAGLTKARNEYLRVVVLYPDQAAYVARSMFYAGLCFRQLADVEQDDESRSRSRRLMRSVIRDFPGSRWAEEAARYAR